MVVDQEQEIEVVKSLLLGQDISLSLSTSFIIQLTIVMLFSTMLIGFAIKKLMQIIKG